MGKSNVYGWNKTLKFTFGHVLAFLALIGISYLSFVGTFYRTSGNFIVAGIVSSSVFVLLLYCFIRIQVLKSTQEKFHKKIVHERWMLGVSVVFFITAMLPCNHFLNIYSQHEKVENLFKEGVLYNGKEMFQLYSKACNQRVEEYEKALRSQKINPWHIEHYKDALKLQLAVNNTESLRKRAETYLQKADQSVSVWNVFLVGNLKQLEKALGYWKNYLDEQWGQPLKYEQVDILENIKSERQERSFNNANKSIREVKGIYEKYNGVSLLTIVFAIVTFVLLLLPYLVQPRNTKAVKYVHLWEKNDEQKETEEKVEEDLEQKSDNPYSGTFKL